MFPKPNSKADKYKQHKEDVVSLRKWANAIFMLDGNKCMNCPQLVVTKPHHIIFRRHSRALKFDIGNGIGLCPECHYKAHNGLGLRSDVTGRQFMIEILEKVKIQRFDKVLEILKKKEAV